MKEQDDAKAILAQILDLFDQQPRDAQKLRQAELLILEGLLDSAYRASNKELARITRIINRGCNFCNAENRQPHEPTCIYNISRDVIAQRQKEIEAPG